MNFLTFPEEMQLPKPIREPNLDEMRKLRSAGKLMVQRKRDGSRVVLLITDTGADQTLFPDAPELFEEVSSHR